jgi:hypothetical protein
VLNKDHLKEQNQTYFQHLRAALKEAFRAGVAVDLLFIHAFFPCLFDKTFSNYIKLAYKRFQKVSFSKKEEK